VILFLFPRLFQPQISAKTSCSARGSARGAEFRPRNEPKLKEEPRKIKG